MISIAVLIGPIICIYWMMQLKGMQIKDISSTASRNIALTVGALIGFP
jgi:hypothetical protein